MVAFVKSPALNIVGISHGYFGRDGGVSSGTYKSLNAGVGSDDDTGNVIENRSRIARALGTAPSKLLSCYQHHSTDVIIAEQAWPKDFRPKADAVVTKTPGIACSALAADCAPVLFADMHNKVIGAAHAGWRGALAGITDETVLAMESLGAARANIVAIIGPCISAPNYEVGPEFLQGFLDQSQTNAQFFTQGQSDRQHFDLKAYLLSRLQEMGVGRCAALPDCTYARPDDYFSYRYNSHNDIKGYGRNISAIMLR